TAFLDLPSDFELVFGPDAVSIYHTLRWHFFLTDPDWQCVMLRAVKRLCDLLGARDCIVTNDGHPAIEAFRNGASFADALPRASGKGEGEVASIPGLFIDKGFAEDLVYLDSDGQCSAVPVWDTRGYWRFKFVEELRA